MRQEIQESLQRLGKAARGAMLRPVIPQQAEEDPQQVVEGPQQAEEGLLEVVEGPLEEEDPQQAEEDPQQVVEGPQQAEEGLQQVVEGPQQAEEGLQQVVEGPLEKIRRFARKATDLTDADPRSPCSRPRSAWPTPTVPCVSTVISPILACAPDVRQMYSLKAAR